MDHSEDKKLHDTIGFVGLRAQATAVGLLQLSAELRRAGVLDDDAIDRIKDAIAREISLSRPRSPYKEQFDENLRGRLDRLFAGEVALDLGSPDPAGSVIK
jgi:hypothetical protein